MKVAEMKPESQNKVLVMEHFMSGENLTWVSEIPVDAMIKFINEHTSEDGEVVLEDMTKEEPIRFKYLTKEEFRECNINGLIWGDGVSRAWAEREVDGLPHPDGVEPDEEDQDNA